MKKNNLHIKIQKLLLPIFFMMNFLSCSKEKEEIDLLSLIQNSEVEPILFSYPGRETPEAKKKEVRNKIVQLIRNAKAKIQIYAYSLNDPDVVIALRDAKKSGLQISILGDRDEDYSFAESLGLSVSLWAGSGLHHIKIMLFDDKTMFTGTGNFSRHGLERDNNAYWITEWESQKFKQFESLLREENDIGILFDKEQLFFSPQAGILVQEELLQAINNAKFRIQFLIFTFYDPILSEALLRASKRGVLVQGIFNQPVNPEGSYLAETILPPSQILAEGNDDIEFRNGRAIGGLLHHKTMIVDGTVYTGSYNYTRSARDDNREMFVRFDDPRKVLAFEREFERIFKNAKPIHKKEDEEEPKSFSLFQGKFMGRSQFFAWPSKETRVSTDSTGIARELQSEMRPVTSPAMERFEWVPVTKESMEDWKEGWGMCPSFQRWSWDGESYWNFSEKILRVITWNGKNRQTWFPTKRGQEWVFGTGFRDLWKNPILVKVEGDNISCYLCQHPPGKKTKWIRYVEQSISLSSQEEKRCLVGN